MAANQTWAVDFIHDSLISGRHFRAFAVLDQCSRENLAIEVDVSLTGERVTRVMERLRTTRGLPTVIQADNGPELRGRALDQWAYEHDVRRQFIEPGKPIQNAHIESFSARLREECLNEHVFVSLDDADFDTLNWSTLPRGRCVTRTHALTVALCTSSPQHRSINRSILASLRRRRAEASEIINLPCVLAATMRDTATPPRSNCGSNSRYH